MAVTAATASIMLVVASAFAMFPAGEANDPQRLSDDDMISVAEYEGQDVLQMKE